MLVFSCVRVRVRPRPPESRHGEWGKQTTDPEQHFLDPKEVTQHVKSWSSSQGVTQGRSYNSITNLKHHRPKSHH